MSPTEPSTAPPAAPKPELLQVLALWLVKVPFGDPSLVILSLVAVLASAYLGWWLGIPEVVAWANQVPWRWVVAWFALVLLACAPLYMGMGLGPLLMAALTAAGTKAEKRELDELDTLEQEIRGSTDPVDYARYSRKALRAYYLMGQNQVSLSFYVGVAAMVFGFVFLVAGLLVQSLDASILPYFRRDLNVSVIAVGGGLIIEFIAATFLWIYRATIVQLNLYYRRQMLVHSALLSVAVAQKMGQNVDAALREIITTLVSSGPDAPPPELPKPKPPKGAKPAAVTTPASASAD